ncbi:tetratricopeptide repeat protein [Streptomyces sp. 891-h]|uniref:tetratricopeptide repeat protein n=1 Tax=unclassified Streptomyces TaxID=2593676 RepID=UPI001FAA1EB8|nr:tetratricopeptide repeat protein [Streptomyces sp. 891-h]UNZ18228.1 sel1 repeat family protein [Streptomyces sp. 891-h]
MTSTGTSAGGELSAEERKYRGAAEEGDAADKQAYGEYLVGRGRVDDAVPWLEEAARGGDARAARLRAITAKDRGQYTVADYWYRTAAERDGDCAFGLAELLLERLDDPEGAAEWYAKGAELGSVKCRTNGALLMLRQGRTDEARDELDEAAPYDHVADQIEDRLIELGARLERYQDRIAELAALRALPPEERPEDLDEQISEFLELEPFSELHTDPEWFTSYPSFLPEAEKVYEEAQALGDPRTDQWHALLHYNLDRYEDACRVLEGGLRRHPESRLLARTLSAVHLQYGELEKYEASLLPGAEAGDRVQQRRLGSYYRDQWRLAEARRWLEAADEGTEGDDDFYEEAAECLEDLEEAEQSTPPALGDEEEPRLAELHEAAESDDRAADLELGRLMERLCRYPEAVRHYKRAAADPGGRHAPAASYALGRMLHEECGAHEKAVVPLYLPAAKAGDLDAIEGLGALYVRLDEPVKAEPWLRRAARFGRPDAASWVGNRVGDDYGDMEEAVRWWTRAAKGGRAWYGWRAGMQLVRWKRYAEAEGLLRLAWAGREKKDPLHEAAYWLGRALRGQGRNEEAVEWLRTARDVHHIVRRGYSGFMLTSLFDPAMELAEVLVNDLATEEAYEEAETLLAPVLERSPQHRTARHLLARVAEQRGDLDTARSHIEEAYTPEGEETGPLLTAEEVAGVLRSVLG